MTADTTDIEITEITFEPPRTTDIASSVTEPPWITAERAASKRIDEAITDSVRRLDDAVGWARSLGELELSETLESLAGKVRAAKRAPRRTTRLVSTEAARFR